MNVYDSRRMADVLRPLGYAEVDTPEDADMMILNTCHIREKATDKVFSEIGRLREHKKEKEARGGKMIMAVAGCVAQAEGKFIMERAPDIDMVFGPQTYHELPEMVLKVTGMIGRPRIVNTDFPPESKFDRLPEENSSQGVSAYLSVQEGCDKFCTFCVVPYTRGAEFSRPVQDVIDEAKKLIEAGAKEITLLGQNVNAYHGTGHNGSQADLADVIHEIAQLPEIERIRYSTSHPRDMSAHLIEAHGTVQKLMPFLHLPVQSGSDKILKAMNRKHGRDLFFEIIDQLRALRKDIVFSSDFIVGFPGETEQDHEDTLDLIRRVGFASAYSFKYSARPGTPAANMTGLLREEVKAQRLQELQDLINAQQYAYNLTFQNQVIPVLFDRKGHKDGQLLGRSAFMHSVHVNAPDSFLGQIAPVHITRPAPNSLSGDLVLSEPLPQAAE
ncbi:MAG: tRNA (N6-isopentenyl adenosine(37)-C2)-methylthiotransferase MiaB [Rhodospirillales bacterium]|nr:tRNA (N6-isopentenyl adenosine(37)-C2)-methylthiotransferase MiaB [Rhodospirillales bacterium]MCB9965011.1 tRNA (N6-isopentenyl adenosine(37)-C2)-methylthiotransferase MiaB [Rhodospirillales bacterium]MCB9980400.1 tRNA (N6-isopentenyl adenosine(37)-C2)-methylthiotransferase MiaB [Rhodospirillales bacterium]